MKTISEQEFIDSLNAFVGTNFKTGSAAAEHYGVSRQYMSAVMKGKHPPNERILKDMGYTRRKVIVYEQVEDSAQKAA